jgi:hypothetical protein
MFPRRLQAVILSCFYIWVILKEVVVNFYPLSSLFFKVVLIVQNARVIFRAFQQ